MRIFGQIVRTVVNVTVVLPAAIVKDVATLGGVLIDEPSATKTAIQLIKDEAKP